MEKGVKIPEDTRITPPVLIGKNCKIGHKVILEGPLVVGKYNVIEDRVALKRTVLWNYNHLKKYNLHSVLYSD